MTLEDLSISSGRFWLSAAVMAVVDVIFIAILVWMVKPSRFRELRWTLVGAAAVLWSSFAVFLVSAFWDSYYRYFYPGWFHSGGVLVFVPLVFGSVAWAFHWLALRLPGNPIVTFSLLCGAESVLEHLWGIYGLRILEIPLLQGSSPASILAFCFPEYIFYWCVVISIAALVQYGWRRLAELRGSRASAA